MQKLCYHLASPGPAKIWTITFTSVYFYTPSYYKKNLLSLSYILKCCFVAKSHLTLGNPKDCPPPGSSVHRVSQAKILGWIAFLFSKGSSWPRDHTRISYITGRFFATEGFPGGSDRNPAMYVQCGRPGLTPGSGRSPGEGNGNPLQYSCLENSMDRGAWQVTIHGVTESDMTEQLSFLLFFFAIKPPGKSIIQWHGIKIINNKINPKFVLTQNEKYIWPSEIRVMRTYTFVRVNYQNVNSFIEVRLIHNKPYVCVHASVVSGSLRPYGL